VTPMTIPPVVKEIEVAAPLERAWSTFTSSMGSCWPLDTHSTDGRRARDVVFEGRAGGRVIERWDDGSERPWAEVLVWEPPHRLVLAWHLNEDRPAATEVEVTFTSSGDRTRLRLEHRGWERLGDEGLESRNDYDSGWDVVLGRYAGAA
jgi:uncharacterized protein YndB with AHSA1/START domain